MRALPIVGLTLLVAGCDDFFDPEFDEGEGEFDDTEFLGTPGEHDDLGLDPEFGDQDPELGDGDVVIEELQLSSLDDAGVWETVATSVPAEVRVLDRDLVSVSFLGAAALGSVVREGGELVLYGTIPWDFVDDGVDGPVEAEVIGTIRPAPAPR